MGREGLSESREGHGISRDSNCSLDTVVAQRLRRHIRHISVHSSPAVFAPHPPQPQVWIPGVNPRFLFFLPGFFRIVQTSRNRSDENVACRSSSVIPFFSCGRGIFACAFRFGLSGLECLAGVMYFIQSCGGSIAAQPLSSGHSLAETQGWGTLSGNGAGKDHQMWTTRPGDQRT
jgi:hypothetical protein